MNKISSVGVKVFSAVLLASVCFAVQAHGLSVPGTSDPWLAGMPAGSSASFNSGSGEPADFAPAQSPVLVPGITISGGTVLVWSATGLVGHPGDIAGPDGATGIFSHFTGAENGISDINAPIDSLLGVFLGPDQPNLISPPTLLDFSSAGARDYTNLSPELQQVFFMGDGLTSGSIAQMIVAPAGATRLYLGTMDGYSWNNNTGSFGVTVSAVPEAGILLLLGCSLLSLAGFRRVLKK
jgi:hypothetical protein